MKHPLISYFAIRRPTSKWFTKLTLAARVALVFSGICGTILSIANRSEIRFDHSVSGEILSVQLDYRGITIGRIIGAVELSEKNYSRQIRNYKRINELIARGNIADQRRRLVAEQRGLLHISEGPAMEALVMPRRTYNEWRHPQYGLFIADFPVNVYATAAWMCFLAVALLLLLLRPPKTEQDQEFGGKSSTSAVLEVNLH